MAASVKMLSLNIEASRHFDKFPQMIRAEDPDVVCLQEVCESDLARIAQLCGYPHYVFCKKLFLSEKWPTMEVDSNWGLALFAKNPFTSRVLTYRTADPLLAKSDYATLATTEEQARAMAGSLLLGTFQKDGATFTIGTIHFTWSLVKENPLQVSDAHQLMRILDQEKNLLLCGDFNVPRGKNACYDVFTQKLTDAIPKKYTNSVDRALHKHREKISGDLLVDYFFHTPGYAMYDVHLINGVSDHYALIGMLEKK